MTRKRDYIPYAERLAAALACLLTQEERDELRSRRAPAPEVISRFHFDHVELHALGGSDGWHNLDPKVIAVHREKSRKDTSIVAKVKRLRKAEYEHNAKMVRGAIEISVEKRKWASRPFPKGRKFQRRLGREDH